MNDKEEPSEELTPEEQQQLEDEYVMHTFHRYPAQLVSGEGMMVYDETGQRAWF